MRRLATAIAAGLLIAVFVAPVQASPPLARGFLPPEAQPAGHSLAELQAAYFQYSAEGVQPNLAMQGRCAPWKEDPKIWFLPDSIGGLTQYNCDLPQGAFALVSPFSVECSAIEAPPFYGATAADRLACASEVFSWASGMSVTYNGQTLTDLARYTVTTEPFWISAPNLLSADTGTWSTAKGIVMVLAPLTPGTHTVSVYAALPSLDWEAGTRFTITVH